MPWASIASGWKFLSPRKHPGLVRKLPNGKLEIVVDAEQPFDQWLGTLEQHIRRVQAT